MEKKIDPCNDNSFRESRLTVGKIFQLPDRGDVVLDKAVRLDITVLLKNETAV